MMPCSYPDWVAGHTAWDRPGENHPDWYIKDAGETLFHPIPIGLQSDMLQALEDDMSYWVEDIGVDGFRCDAAYNISIEFWKKTIDRLYQTKPVYIQAESGKIIGGYPLN